MQNIKAAIGEDDFPAGVAEFTNPFRNCTDGIDFCGHCSWRLDAGEKSAADSGNYADSLRAIRG